MSGTLFGTISRKTGGDVSVASSRSRDRVLYWLKLTESLMEPGNAAFARDHAEWDAMWE